MSDLIFDKKSFLVINSPNKLPSFLLLYMRVMALRTPFTQNTNSLYTILREKSILNANFIRKKREIIVKKYKLQKILFMKSKKRSTAMAKTTLISLAAGALAGLVNGLFGGGGGMIIVPSLKYLLRYKTNSAHATAIAVILPLSVLSGIFYTVFGNFELQPALFTTAGVLAGGIFGAVLLKKLSSKPLTLIFSSVMAIAGVKMLFF